MINRLNFYNQVSKAESLPTIESNSVQLMIASSAVHWFNLNEFFTEAKRVLAPKGVLALIGKVGLEPKHPDCADDTRLTDLMMSLIREPSLIPYTLYSMFSKEAL